MNDELTFWRTIELTKGQRAMVDVADHEALSKYKWHASGPVQSTGAYYAIRKVRVGNKQEGCLMHRQLLGAQKGQEVDHWSGDTLDNRRANLRLTDRRGNQQNRSDHSPYGPGVRKRESRYPLRPFEARVFLRGVARHVGQFATPEEARAARAAFLAEKLK